MFLKPLIRKGSSQAIQMVATLARLGDARKEISLYGFYNSIISAQQRLNNIPCYYFRAKKTGFDFMKFLIISLIILFSLSVGFVGVAQGIFWNDDPRLVEVSIQIQIRDSEGRLVAYVEPTQTWATKSIHYWLDKNENNSIILKDGKNLVVSKWEQSKSYKGNKLPTAYGGNGFSTFTGGFLTEPGDTATISWKVVRLLK